jgi:hypothetical protein
MNFIIALLFFYAIVTVNGSPVFQRQLNTNSRSKVVSRASDTTAEATTAEATTVEDTTAEATTAETTAETTSGSSTTAPALMPCAQNSDCPATLPFCQEGVCQSCLTDYDCRNQTRCNSVCITNNLNQNKCVTPMGETRLVCEVNEVCYKYEASCQRSCLRSGTSSNGDPVFCDNTGAFTIPVGKVCDPATGMCIACLRNDDCGVSANATCNSMCKYDSSHSSCSTGTTCTSSQSCLFSSTTTNYVCSSAVMLGASTLLAMMLAVLF